MTKNRKKITAVKKFNFLFDQKLQFTYSLASIKNVQVTEEAFSSQKRPSNTLKHELLNFFLLLWFIFGLLDPDPDSESGSGSTDPIESGSNPDPDTDPQPCLPQPLVLDRRGERCVLRRRLNGGLRRRVQPPAATKPNHKLGAEQYFLKEVNVSKLCSSKNILS
jgi:hypothetical protein